MPFPAGLGGGGVDDDPQARIGALAQADHRDQPLRPDV
jgi:hypothetical protein